MTCLARQPRWRKLIMSIFLLPLTAAAPYLLKFRDDTPRERQQAHMTAHGVSLTSSFTIGSVSGYAFDFDGGAQLALLKGLPEVEL
eukprot:1225404-Prymnesium_polylepis.1